MNERCRNMTDPALGQIAPAMRSRHENGANDTRVAAEMQSASESANDCPVTAQSPRRHHEQRVPQLLAARADQGVRAQTTHAVSENDDMSRREIVIARIETANRLLEFLAQLERVKQHRRARAVQKCPNLEVRAHLRVAT